ncbi:hypothetical protein SAMN05444362_12322 [Dysgonomonas macrotermitis]|uniref:Uncharacterized protein n=1 Tax=Dysgonomonas macrotermitis TaxID=1346286 RepID=A0A1M5JED4_9BACT|nr:hypothetical protein SAMN05444362_12322 [Dysgonomonas macrotermitis]
MRSPVRQENKEAVFNAGILQGVEASFRSSSWVRYPFLTSSYFIQIVIYIFTDHFLLWTVLSIVLNVEKYPAMVFLLIFSVGCFNYLVVNK